jgi:hypothetical protein
MKAPKIARKDKTGKYGYAHQTSFRKIFLYLPCVYLDYYAIIVRDCQREKTRK